jgi:hypothetical protein
MASRRQPQIPSIARDATREITALSWAAVQRTAALPARAAARVARTLLNYDDVWMSQSRYPRG